MVADRKLVERIKKDLLGTTLYNYQDSYTVCGICSDFVADTYNQSQGFVFLPCDFKYYVGHCYLKCVPGKAEENAGYPICQYEQGYTVRSYLLSGKPEPQSCNSYE